MLEIRFGVVAHYTERRGIVPDGKQVDGTVTFRLSADQLAFWARQAIRANKPVEFEIKLWGRV